LARRSPKRRSSRIISAVRRISQRLRRSLWSSVDVRRFPPRKRTHFFVNLGIGIGIVILLHFLQHTRWGEGTLDHFFDLFIRSESSKAVRIQNDIQSSPLLFVDIDHKTYKEWGEPLITPRDKLARILRILHEGEAKLIVLDILLEGRDARPENDRLLLDVLRDIQLDAQGTTKIIVPQRIGVEGDLKPALFDALFEKPNEPQGRGPQNIYRATPTLSATGSDNVVRYWNLYEEYRGEDGRPGIIWGYPITAVLLAVEGDLRKLGPFEEILRRSAGRHGGGYRSLDLANGKAIKLPYDKAHLYLQRLRFLLVPERSIKDASAEAGDGIEGNLFQTVISFKELEYYQGSFKEKIVIVGNSSPDVGDIQRTPVGEMAGMYVIGNSIHTILVKEQPSPPPVWLSIIMETAVIVLAAYVFLYFTSLLAQIVATGLILLIFGYFSYLYFLKAGVFLNFVFAIVGMGFHETVADIEEIIEQKGGTAYSHDPKD
jgi:CHASE2 domain-containing sensor protein